MELTEEMKKLGLTQDAIYMPDFNTADYERSPYLSNPHAWDCPVKPVMIKTNSVDEYKEWMAYEQKKGDKANERLLSNVSLGEIPGIATKMDDLSSEHLENLKKRTNAYVTGQITLNDNEKKIIEAAFAPFKVAVYAINNLIIDAQRMILLSGGPVILFVGSVTFKYSAPRNGAFYINNSARIVIDRVMTA